MFFQYCLVLYKKNTNESFLFIKSVVNFIPCHNHLMENIKFNDENIMMKNTIHVLPKNKRLESEFRIRYWIN